MDARMMPGLVFALLFMFILVGTVRAQRVDPYPKPPTQFLPGPSTAQSDAVSNGVGKLCELGYANPQGCEYREIEVRTDSWGDWTNLKTRMGDSQRRNRKVWNLLERACLSPPLCGRSGQFPGRCSSDDGF